MSRFMSHRQMKAADKALGEYRFRTQFLERVITKLLERSDLTVVVDEKTDEIELLTKAEIEARIEEAKKAQPKSSDIDYIREIPEDEAA